MCIKTVKNPNKNTFFSRYACVRVLLLVTLHAIMGACPDGSKAEQTTKKIQKMKNSTINPSRALRRLLNITLLAFIAGMSFSCSGDGDGDGQTKSHEIRFSSVLSGDQSVTRADTRQPLHEIGVKQFKVYGFKAPKTGDLQTVFNNEAVNYTDVEWAYEMPRYWDLSAKEYMFFGYNTGVGDNTSPGTKAEASISGNTVTYTCVSIPFIEEREDGTLWTMAKKTGPETPAYQQIHLKDIPFISHIWKNAPTPNSKVGLSFFAPYVKVSVRFSRIHGVDEKATTIKHIHFAPKTTSHAIFDHPDIAYKYDLANGKETYEVTRLQDHLLIFDNGLMFDDMVKTEMMSGVETEVGILEQEDKLYQAYPTYWTFPATSSDFTNFELSATIGGETQVCSVPPEYTKWDIGYHYIYDFCITRQGVECINVIKVGIKKWESIGSTETEFYNW